MIAIHPLGFILAVVFAVSMGGLMWWMLRVPAPIPAAVAKARVSVEAVKRILVPTVGTAFAGREVELACRLGEDQKAEIQLAYLLEVPRTLSLGAPMPDEEARGLEAMKLAKTIIDLHKLPSTMKVLRARVAGARNCAGGAGTGSGHDRCGYEAGDGNCLRRLCPDHGCPHAPCPL